MSGQPAGRGPRAEDTGTRDHLDRAPREPDGKSSFLPHHPRKENFRKRKVWSEIQNTAQGRKERYREKGSGS